MKLTAKSRYAVTALLDLAIHTPNTRVTLADIAGRHHISLSYLEQWFSRLRKAGFDPLLSMLKTLNPTYHGRYLLAAIKDD